jgi:hypothetical protein
MNRKQGPHEMGMRPAVIAASLRQGNEVSRHNRTEEAA